MTEFNLPFQILRSPGNSSDIIHNHPYGAAFKSDKKSLGMVSSDMQKHCSSLTLLVVIVRNLLEFRKILLGDVVFPLGEFFNWRVWNFAFMHFDQVKPDNQVKPNFDLQVNVMKCEARILQRKLIRHAPNFWKQNPVPYVPRVWSNLSIHSPFAVGGIKLNLK